MESRKSRKEIVFTEATEPSYHGKEISPGGLFTENLKWTKQQPLQSAVNWNNWKLRNLLHGTEGLFRTMDTSEEQPNDLVEPDVLSIERRLQETLHELNLKRLLLDGCRRDLNDAVLVQHDLERLLDRERHEVEETRMQLKLAMLATCRWEEERSSITETASRQQVQLEVMLKERDVLKDQARAVQLENAKLIQSLEEHKSWHKCQLAFQESTILYQNKVKESMKEVQSQMQKLEQEQQNLDHTVEAVKTLSSQLQLHAKYHDSIQAKGQQQMEGLERMVVVLRAELDKMKINQKISTLHERQSDCPHSNTASLLTEMRVRLTAECESSLQLTQALNAALKVVKQAQEQEAVMQKKVLDITAELQKEHRCLQMLQTKNESLQEQLNSTQQELMTQGLLKECHKCIECEVQIESVTERNSAAENITVAELPCLEPVKCLDLPLPSNCRDLYPITELSIDHKDGQEE